MKLITTCLLFLLLASCSTTSKQGLTKKIINEYEIVKTLIVSETDTISSNELRFYQIQSCMDCMKMAFENYGKEFEKYEGKYQDNVPQVIWRDVKLFDSDETYTLIADGTETMENYFASIMIIDSSGNNCLNEGYEKREQIIELIQNKMQNTSSDSWVYGLF